MLINSENRGVITDFGSARKVEPHLRETESHTDGTALQAEPTVSSAQENELLQVKVDDCETSMTLTGPAYTLRWAAPEMVKDEGFGLGSDMWALAWICWEVRTQDGNDSVY